jgi:phosphate transport system protein
MDDHTLTAIDADLGVLTQAVTAMGDLAVTQVRASVDVFQRHDLQAAGKVVRADDALDLQDAEIEKAAVRFIALRQPVADDLRRPIAAMKIAMQLERCGDLAKNIAKRCLVLAEAEPLTPLTRSIERMGNLVAARLKDVLDAYTSGNLDRAVAVWARDDEVDEHYNSLFRELLTYMMADPRTINSCAHLLFIAKNLERIGDHATNLAEIVYFEITGEDLISERPKSEALQRSVS